MQTLADLKPGDVVVRTRSFQRNSEPEQVEVAKVGRKLITIMEYGRPVQFRIEDGSFNDKNYPYHQRIRTLDQYEYDTRMSELYSRLMALGIRPSGVGKFEFSMQTMEKLIKVLEEDQ